MSALWLLLGAFGGAFAIVSFVVLYPEKIEKWAAAWWRILSGVVQGAHKRYVKHDLQGRVNDFTKRLRKKAPELHKAKLKLEWIDSTETRDAFMADGKVVIRLRRDDPEDHNFVHGVHHYISTVFLHRAKTYLTKSQRDSIDIFTCTKIFESEKAEVVDYFLSKYLHPITDDRKGKVSSLIMRFERLYEADLFFPVFVQEMQFLGYRVFGKRKDDEIHHEVAKTIEVLEEFAGRQLGEEGDNEFLGSYCKFAIVIAGRAQIIQESIGPYVNYLLRLLDDGFESIYILSPISNKSRLDTVCERLAKRAVVHRHIELDQVTHSTDEDRRIRACLFVVRNKEFKILHPPES